MLNFSIILPLRNGGDYLKQCVHSILDQSYPHFNLLVLENASSDESLAWLKSLSDDRIFLFPSDQSLSIEENWNRIVSLKKNEFITLIGHDDILHEDYLQVMVDLINQYPNASLYQTQFNYINSQGALIRPCKHFPQKLSYLELTALIFKKQIDINGTGYMMRSSHYDELNGIPNYPNLLFADFELWVNMSEYSYMVTSPQTCFSYRIHQSMTTVSSDKKFQDAFIRLLEYFLKKKKTDMQFKSLVDLYLPDFIMTYVKSISHRILRTPLNKRNKVTVQNWIEKCQIITNELFDVKKAPVFKDDLSVKISLWIDGSLILRSLFLFYKKIFPKPLFK
jgi:glycosyltransferase involved in cell wall biosynthesis